MPLRRFQPISPSAQWSDTLSWRDPRTGELNSLAGATVTMALYQRSRGCGPRYWGGDYGWPLYGRERPILSAQTQPDGSGPLIILPDQLHAQFIFPAGSLPNIAPGDAELIAWATVNGATDEIERATIRVLDGPRVMPGAATITGLPDQDITVTIDGGLL
jgi:hypothetical protein